MPIKRCQASIDVLEAARKRIVNVFNNNVPVYLSFSGGKDSLVMAHLILFLIQSGQINPELLTVQFIDEEAIFPCVEETVLQWRKTFLLCGAKFEWYCIVVRHFNCFNELSQDESFICWDSEKEDVWIRKPPSFAIRNHPLLKARQDTYQDFMPRICRDGITVTGVRAAESLQRLEYIAKTMTCNKGMNTHQQVWPIYDWRDHDVWLYLYQYQIEIPAIYLYLWQSGLSKKNLRVSQFFSIDTARSLVKMDEYYPDLMERIIKREPNAYLAALYWDSEMFGRRSNIRKKQEKDTVKKDYQAELIKVFNHMSQYFPTPHKMTVAQRYRKFFLKASAFIDQKDCQMMYEALMSGDPKYRKYRALYQQIYGRYIKQAKQEVKERNNG